MGKESEKDYELMEKALKDLIEIIEPLVKEKPFQVTKTETIIRLKKLMGDHFDILWKLREDMIIVDKHIKAHKEWICRRCEWLNFHKRKTCGHCGIRKLFKHKEFNKIQRRTGF